MADSERPSFSIAALVARLRRLFPWPGQPPIVRPDPADLDRERLRSQVAVIRKAFGGEVAVAAVDGGGGARDDSEMAYLYHPRRALVREDRFDEARLFFENERDRFDGGLERDGSPIAGLLSVILPGRADGGDTVLTTLNEVDDALGRGAMTPDHVVYVVGYGRICPATEPDEPSSGSPVPPVATNQKAGAEVRVAVVDTGWWAQAGKNHAWLSGVAADPSDLETVNPSAIHEYAGHGTFVAGVVRCLAPSAAVEVEGFLPKGGAVYESEICKQLDEAITDENRPQIISISAGTHTRLSIPLLGFEILAAVKSLLDPANKVLVVAAAGNDGSTEKFYPAAFDWVVGVGSVDSNGKISDFSNTSDPNGDDWVNVYARGRDVVNAFPNGTYTCYEPENIHNGVPDVRHFRGMARWSGTSFSTPIVSGAIAAQMSAMQTDDPRAAYDALLKGATQSTNAKVGTFRTIGPL